jgi:glycosyltransferase involved in cell wall biosynthesis
MDMNIVPSKFSQEVFTKAGFTKNHNDGRKENIKVTKPIEVAFEGVNTEIFKKTQKPLESIDKMMDKIPESFCFLMVGHWLQGELGADRKDIGMLVKVFSEVFKNKKNAPALVLKTSGATFSHVDKDEILKKINRARVGLEGNLPNVYLVHGDLGLEEMNRLYNHPKVKVHVCFTHGEGFGRPLLEASLSGKPVIASGWSGQLDFLPKNLAVLLPGSLTQIPDSAVNDWLIKEASWYTVNYSVAAGKMNDTFENYANYLANAELLRQENSQKFTLEAGNKLLVSVIEKHLPVFEKKVEIVLPKFKKIEKV